MKLGREWDLLDSEEALKPGPLELQVKVLELSSEDPLIKRVAHKMLDEAPLWKLFRALVQQAIQSDVDQINIEFKERDNRMFPVLYRTAMGWEEVMGIPATLWLPFKGLLKVVERAGPTALAFQKAERFVYPHGEWASESKFELTLVAQ